MESTSTRYKVILQYASIRVLLVLSSRLHALGTEEESSPLTLMRTAAVLVIARAALIAGRESIVGAKAA